MKRIIVSILVLFALCVPSFAIKAVDWNIGAIGTSAAYCPSSGIFKDVGARSVTVTTTNCATATLAIYFYNSTASPVLSSETITVNVPKTLLSPYFALGIISTEAITGLASSEVYILN